MLKKVNKQAADEVFGVIKDSYQLSLVQILKVNGWLKRIIAVGTVSVLLSSGYIGIMFGTGKWKGKISSASIEISSNIVGIGNDQAYKVKINTTPFFAKKPIEKVLSEDLSIAKIENGKIQGVNEGKTNIVLYLDEKQVRKVPITVSQIGVKDFKVHYNGELKGVGDSIYPNIEIIYFNDIKKENVNTSLSSSNERVIMVQNNKLVAVGQGNAVVTVKVNELEKKLVFNISNEKTLEDSSSKLSYKNDSNDLTYSTYTNTKYGFSIDYPTNLITSTPTTNGDGLLFRNNDGTVSIIAIGRNNVLNETAESLYNNDLSKLKVTPVYKSLVENSYAISWKENGLAYYEYYTVGGNNGSIQGFIIKYPVNENDTYAPMVSRVYKSFKANEIDKAH